MEKAYTSFIEKLNKINAKKLAVVGSQNFPYIPRATLLLEEIVKNTGIDTIVSGGADGIDTMAEEYADKNSLEKIIHPAEIDNLGRSVGFVRNEFIVRDADAILIFWYKKSNGTEHTLNIAKSSGKPVHLLHIHT